MKNQQGTTLVEVLAALVILGIVGVGFIWAMTDITRTTPMVDDKTTALSLAESQIEYIRNQEYGWDYLKVGTPQGFHIHSPMAFPLDANGDGSIKGEENYIQKIRVDIWVPEANGGSKVVTTLEEYRTL